VPGVDTWKEFPGLNLENCVEMRNDHFRISTKARTICFQNVVKDV